MDRLTLVQIKWTNNIAKHLYLEEDRRFVHTVHIFSHTTLMHTLAKLLLETMDTLDLLLDLHDSECQNWYRKLRKKDNKQRQKENRPTGGLDENAGTPKRSGSLAPSDVDELRRVGHYDFWQPRLLKLETAFRDSKPRAIGGWWRDKRDRGIWATFIGSFLAILIAVFAIVVAIGSIVTGSMSVELAEDANKMAAKGLDKDTIASSTVSKAGGPLFTTVTVQGCCSCTSCDLSGPRSKGSVTETRVVEQVAESTPCT
ncbi:hypothetical protein NLU13_8121 [Sarocladium strictum]|uniref:Uncharacterized protein n=1 Tax=Sarocladium strictum TaxID=5046 RepID=A0AA39L4P0_SARSR|nr:hypothetical protein NLU13_8121 [Sarocladium strictum]